MWWIAVIVLGLGTIGAVVLLRRNRPALGAILAAFGPYFVFDVVFQETFTSRYALPLVIPAAFLAVAGARALPRRIRLVVIALTAAYVRARRRHVGRGVREPEGAGVPAARGHADRGIGVAERRSRRWTAARSLDLRRPIIWVGAAMPALAQRLPSPPQHEVARGRECWNGGGRAPVWFVADPLRADVDLIGHRRRPNTSGRCRIRCCSAASGRTRCGGTASIGPEWYVGEGWSLTPESAGVAEVERRGLVAGAIDGWIARESLGGTMVVGGRNLEERAAIDGRRVLESTTVDERPVAPGFLSA